MAAPSTVHDTALATPTDGLDRLRPVLLAALILLLPLATVEVLWWAPGGGDDFNRRITFAPFDLVQIGLLVVAAAQWTRRTSRLALDTGARLALAGLAAVFLASFAVHPSPRAADLLLRLLAAAAIVDAFRRVGAGERKRLLGLLLAVGSTQAAVALLQSARGEAFGFQPLDFPGPLYTFGTSHAGRGGLTHPYHLVVFLLVAIAAGVIGARGARRPRPWLVGLALCGAGVGVTYSRAAVLAVVPAGILVLVIARRTRSSLLVAATVAVAVGLGATALSLGDGWYSRVESSTKGQSVTSGRTDLWGDALDMAADNPLLGVGPGRYTIELAGRAHDGELLPPHNAVLQVSAEVGFPAAVLVTVIAATALTSLWRRRGALALLPVVVLLPYYLLDAYPYVFPTGIAVSALAACAAVSVPERSR